MLEINETYSQIIEVKARFTDKINILSGRSGTGKTFLFSVIAGYCANNGIKCINIDYKFKDVFDAFLIEKLKQFDVICLDNADLYMNCERFDQLYYLDRLMIISIHNLSLVDMTLDSVGSYQVDYTKDRMYVYRRSR